MKPKLILCLALVLGIVWLVPVLSAYAVSVEISVTPQNLNQRQYVFSISTNAAPNGIFFHVNISATKDAIYSDSTVDVCTVVHTSDSSSIESTKHAIKIVLKKDIHVWKANFIVSNKMLKSSNLYFIFTEFTHVEINGKSVVMPSATFYEIKLKDFLK
jgi:hypothetical protein